MSSHDFSDRWASLSAPNPLQPLAVFKPLTLPTRRIRALTSDYYIDGGKVAEAGKVYVVPADLAAGLVAQRRAEYAPQ